RTRSAGALPVCSADARAGISVPAIATRLIAMAITIVPRSLRRRDAAGSSAPTMEVSRLERATLSTIPAAPMRAGPGPCWAPGAKRGANPHRQEHARRAGRPAQEWGTGGDGPGRGEHPKYLTPRGPPACGECGVRAPPRDPHRHHKCEDVGSRAG